MNYARVINNQVTQIGLPQTGTINEQTVSNYDLLPVEVLMGEGWLPIVDNPPVCGEDEYINQAGFEVHETQVVALYTVLPKPVEIYMPTLEDRVSIVESDIAMQNDTIGEILETIIPTLIGG